MVLAGLWAFLLCACVLGHPKQTTSGGEDMRNCSVTPPYLPVTAVNTTARLKDLRQQLETNGLDAYIIPDTDAHLSEYLAKHDERRWWMSGFSGSAGNAVVSKTKAALWTDSRYWIQAERQMDCNWELHKEVGASPMATWILAEIPAGGRIGFDPFLFSIDTWKSLDLLLQGTNRSLVAITDNLVDQVWGTERPSLPSQPIYYLQENFIGSTWQDKVTEIRNQMQKHDKAPTAVLLSALDETAWLFNLRSDDVPYNPFFYSYTLLTNSSIRLFVNASRLSNNVLQYLNSDCTDLMCVQIEDYGQIRESVQEYASGDVRIWLGTEYTTYGLYGVIPQEKLVEDSYSPVMVTKAVKNTKEQELLKAAHVRDAVAVIRYLVWLEKNVPQGTVDEFSGAEQVNKFRGEEEFSSGPSFETISASGLNAALAHYSPTKEIHRSLSQDEMYLLDSGGQYWDGTTDITRTVHWGIPSSFQKEAYTRVLMGNIDLCRLVFPSSTSGRVVEAFARRALWEAGLNYGHGTGHGIGNFLSVHEWPVGFQSSNIAMTKGMFTSIEPGYYQDGEFGIRIEDVVLVVEAQTKYGGSFLAFEVVSLVPYSRNLIDTSLLLPEQLEYLNQYYRTIRQKIGPELQRRDLKQEYEWLLQNTEPLSNNSSWAQLPASLTVLVAASLASVLGQSL
ncbi:xaa-Pro aminopeptidase 2 [Trichosurus vulpecula]|uniref:xaa-Pro aminopeptidase 2 n=1 Tax=Trichosurus vulpecula TaxID=9337 RepID=UPI00186B03F7|nr:xaa-Pro aminopeptidase 2 [Trichosurus vulpecula]